MNNKNFLNLEEAYISINKKIPSVPSDKEKVTLTDEHNNVPENLDDEIFDDNVLNDNDTDKEEKKLDIVKTFSAPVFDSASCSSDCNCGDECGCGGKCSCGDVEDYEEEDMNISNLNSLRESLMKVSLFCSQGGRLEPWQEQKLAICMDNLAEVARRLR